MNTNLAHPPTLKIFFATEMWERYGFYVVQSLLALYMAFHFKWPDHEVYTLVGSFTALTYLSPVVGGWIADHLLGQKKAILLGSVWLFISYLALSLSSSSYGLMTSLAGVAVGTGLFKPNISSLLGNMYPNKARHRQSGFTIFYMGITLGIILGTSIPSQLSYYFGWSTSFLSAALGMILAAMVFSFGVYQYNIADYHPRIFRGSDFIKSIAILLFLWLLSFYILNHPRFANLVFVSVVILSALYLIYAVQKESKAQATRNIVIGLLCVISIIFWAFYFQMFLSLTLFITRVVKANFLHIHFPPPYYVTVESLGMLFFGYIIANPRFNITSAEPGLKANNQFMSAILLLNFAYGIIFFTCYYNVNGLLLSPLYFIAAYLVISLAELLLSPVGLAIISLLASREKVSTMVGIFFVSLGIGAFLAGKLANLTAINEANLSLIDFKMAYTQGFKQLLLILLALTGVCLGLYLIVQRLLNTLKDPLTAK